MSVFQFQYHVVLIKVPICQQLKPTLALYKNPPTTYLSIPFVILIQVALQLKTSLIFMN